MELIEQHWFILLAALGAAACVWFFVAWRSESSDQSRNVATLLIFGPFAPLVRAYLSKRDGFTRREWTGWAIVIGLIVAAIAFTLITGIGVRGG